MVKNLTRGTPARLILGFALPLLIGNLFQQLYLLADTVILGRILGVHALAAVGSTGSIMFFIIGFIQSMTAGFSIVTAQHFGACRRADVRRSFCVTISLSLSLGLILTITGVALARPILELLETPPEIIDAAHSYISVIYTGIGSAVLFNLLSNTLLALGDSRPPLIFLVVSNLFSVLLDFVFILGLSWGVAGAAWATVSAQMTSAVLCVLYIRRRIPALRLRRKDWHLTWTDLRKSMRIGLPMGFQASIIALGAIILQWVLNTLGAISVAAFTVARTIDLVAILPMMSFGLAMATYVGQNYGARDIPRIRLGVLHCCAMSLTFSVCIGLVNIFGGYSIVTFFIGADKHEVASLAQIFLTVSGCAYWILSLLFIFRFTLQGLGQSLVPTVAGILELGMRALAAIFLARHFGFLGACIANPLAWLGACVPLAWAYRRTVRKWDSQAEREKTARPTLAFPPEEDKDQKKATQDQKKA
ncbi:MAG: MATE family efflux transporter [Desulfovibrio sp.]|jgi:putative MATE family efflux protein|nr:MATE family efflux transporter [Desulfovibrio sp.]